MFIENSLLHFIEVDAQDVVAMYRSGSSVKLRLGGRPQQSCEAFICVTNDGDSTSVYVALSLLQSKSFVLFVPERQPRDKETSELVLKDAHDFVKEFGFEMQNINLNYSKALKEVVLNDLRVVRSATSGKKISQRKGAAEKTSRAQQDISVKSADAEDKSNGKVKASASEQEKRGVKVPVDAPSGRKADSTSQSVKSIPDEDPDLVVEKERKDQLIVDKAAAEKIASETLALLRADNEQLEKEICAFHDKSNTEIEALKAGLEDLGLQKAAAEADAEKELARLTKESQRLSGEISLQEKSSEDKLSALVSEIEKLTQAKKEAEEDASRKISAAEKEINSLKAGRTDFERDTAAEIAALQAELEQLSAARSSTEKERAREIAVLKSEIEAFTLQAGTDQELELLRNELERLTAEKSVSGNGLQDELSDLRQQRATLEGEIKSIESQGMAELSASRAELEECALEKQRVSGEVEQELLSVRSEIEQLRSDIAVSREAVAEELAALVAEQKNLQQEKIEAEQSADVELSGLRAEILRIAEEKKAVEDSCAVTLADLNGETERLAAEKSQQQRESAEEQSALQERILQLKEEIAAARDSSEKLLVSLRLEEEKLLVRKKEDEEAAAAEISAREEELSHLRKDLDSARIKTEKKIAELKAGIEKLESEKISLEESTAQEIASLSEQEEQLARQMPIDEAAAAEELAALRSRVSTISAENEKKIASTKAMISKNLSEIERLESEGESRANEASAQLIALKGRVLQFADDLLQSEKQAAEKTRAARNTARSLIAALSGDEELHGENTADPDMENWLAALQQEADQLLAEKSALENTSAGEVAMLRAKVTSLAAEKIAVEKNLAREVEALHLEAERLVAEKLAAEKAAKEVLAEVTADVERLAEEKTAAEKQLREKISNAGAAAQKLIDEKVEVEKREEHEAEVQEETVIDSAQIPEDILTTDVADASIEAGVSSLSANPIAMENFSIDEGPTDSPGVVKDSSIESDESDPFAFLKQEGSFDFGSQPSFGRKSSDKPVAFIIDKSKMRVDYLNQEDVLEIYKSLNRTRVAREDNTTVTCDAYMLSLRENGMPHVYIAFYLVDSKEVMVYVPEKQPANAEEFADSMNDGFDFIEIVGFMMDPMDLGNDAASRKKNLDKIPVLQKSNTAGG